MSITDATIRAILEQARDDSRRHLDNLSREMDMRRAELRNLESNAIAETERLDAIEAELGIGSFAEAIS